MTLEIILSERIPRPPLRGFLGMYFHTTLSDVYASKIGRDRILSEVTNEGSVIKIEVLGLYHSTLTVRHIDDELGERYKYELTPIPKTVEKEINRFVDDKRAKDYQMLYKCVSKV